MSTGPTDPGSSSGNSPSGNSPDSGGASTGGGSRRGGAGPTPPPTPESSKRPTSAADDQGPAAPPTPFTQQLGRVTIVVLAVLFGIFAVANSQRVDFSWVIGETLTRESASGEVTGGVPLILLLLAAFAIGAAVTLLVELFVSRGRRARRNGSGKESGKDRKK